MADRGVELLEGLAGPSLISELAQQALAQPGEAGDDKALMVASQLEQIGQDIGAQTTLGQRLLANVTQGVSGDHALFT